MPERLYCPLEVLSYPIFKKDLQTIKSQIFDMTELDTFYLESNKCIFFLDRVNKKVKIIERLYTKNEEKNLLIDSYCMVFLKMMKKMGFEISLENKYCN